MSEDPIGLRNPDQEGGGGAWGNLYAYVLNNPVLFVDPSGLWRYAQEYGTKGNSLTPNMRNAESQLDAVFNGVAGRDAVVTYTTNGRHEPGSLHPSGNAVDLRTRNLTPAQIRRIAEELRRVLGDDYDVVVKRDHIHVEYDPQPPRRCP